MDELTATMTCTNVTSGTTVIDDTPTLTGTLSAALAANEVVRVYEGATLIGVATVDPVTRAWTLPVVNPLSAGAHTFTAKVETYSGTVISTSSNFSLTVSGNADKTTVPAGLTPLVLDLDGDGIETTNLLGGTVFDLDANGQLERAAWVAGGDGLLVRDLDGNGLIDNGAELFGSGTTLANGQKALDGFAALAGLDSNGDGVINSQDAAFAQLQVWVDANGDGQTDAGELRSLASLGIASLGLHAQASDLQNNGNIVGLLGSYTTTDGTQHTLADVWLQNQSLPTLDLTQVLKDGVAEMTNTHPEVLRLNVSDMLQLPTNASGQHVLQVQGDANDAVNLSNLLDSGAAQGTWQASGSVVQGGVTYNAYSHSADASLQVLIDQHITQVHVG